MPDSLVRYLNQRGYQPVLLPRTGARPPDLYAMTNSGLDFIGSLISFLPGRKRAPKCDEGALADIQEVETTAKSLEGSVSFLKNVFHTIGLSGAPKAAANAAKNAKFMFRFENVTYTRAGLVDLSRLVAALPIEGVPAAYRSSADLHVAYEYLYAAKLTMQRSGSASAGAGAATGTIDQMFSLQAKGRIKSDSLSTLSFKARDEGPAVFAYKALKLRRLADGWMLEAPPIDSAGFIRTDEAAAGKPPYLPLPGRLAKVRFPGAEDIATD